MQCMSNEYGKNILEAIPLPVFVVDEDVVLRDTNSAANLTFGEEGATILSRRGGEVLHCLHSYETAGGCGRSSFCARCLIRGSVGKAIAGHAVTRRRVKVEVLRKGGREEAEYLITASPMPAPDDHLVLLIIEDINEMTRLRNIIPICARCKKIRDDRQFWQSVELYFREYIGVDFSHGICPDCARELYPEFCK